jgi:hypothetical protein
MVPSVRAIPRKAFDAVERPVSSATGSLLQKDAVMDALALTWKLQRSARHRVESGTAAAMRVVGVPTRGDVTDLVKQIAGLQREVRELRREVETH